MGNITVKNCYTVTRNSFELLIAVFYKTHSNNTFEYCITDLTHIIYYRFNTLRIRV